MGCYALKGVLAKAALFKRCFSKMCSLMMERKRTLDKILLNETTRTKDPKKSLVEHVAIKGEGILAIGKSEDEDLSTYNSLKE